MQVASSLGGEDQAAPAAMRTRGGRVTQSMRWLPNAVVDPRFSAKYCARREFVAPLHPRWFKGSHKKVLPSGRRVGIYGVHVFRGFHGIGCALQDFLAGVESVAARADSVAIW